MVLFRKHCQVCCLHIINRFIISNKTIFNQTKTLWLQGDIKLEIKNCYYFKILY